MTIGLWKFCEPVSSDALAAPDSDLPAIEPIPPFQLSDFSPEDGWKEAPSGLLFRIDKEGKGDAEKGIFDAVDHFQPFPFVTVRFTAYTPDGKSFASSSRSRRPTSYQVDGAIWQSRR